MTKINPFITSGYISAKYFCDRITETTTLTRYITNGNNVALISPRRLGKTGLIEHCFHQQQIRKVYHTFLIDIYATKNFQEFVFELGKGILNGLKPRGRKAWELFLKCLSSLRTSISFDFSGNPSWNLEMGDIKTPAITLDEIFRYLEEADKPCLISIDEFQVIAKYPEGDVEAILRTHIQHCSNAKFIYDGSQRHMMGEIFTSPSRPFYQSTAIMELSPINADIYTEFIKRHFAENKKKIAVDLKSATKLFSVLLASKRPLITELADKLRLKYPLLPTISPCPTMRLEAIRSIIPISCRRYPKSV